MMGGSHEVEGGTRFHRAARDNYTDVLREATRRDCNRPDEDGMTPTLWASFFGNLESLRILVGRGGDPDQTDLTGNTALHWAANNGHLNCVSFLVNFGINLWILNNEHQTAKDVAGLHSLDQEILHLLDLEMGSQSALNPKSVRKMKEKACIEADKRIHRFDKLQQKAHKRAEKEEKEMEKRRNKMLIIPNSNNNKDVMPHIFPPPPPSLSPGQLMDCPAFNHTDANSNFPNEEADEVTLNHQLDPDDDDDVVVDDEPAHDAPGCLTSNSHKVKVKNQCAGSVSSSSTASSSRSTCKLSHLSPSPLTGCTIKLSSDSKSSISSSSPSYSFIKGKPRFFHVPSFGSKGRGGGDTSTQKMMVHLVESKEGPKSVPLRFSELVNKGTISSKPKSSPSTSRLGVVSRILTKKSFTNSMYNLSQVHSSSSPSATSGGASGPGGAAAAAASDTNDGDFKIRQKLDPDSGYPSKSSVRSLAGFRRDSEVLYTIKPDDPVSLLSYTKHGSGGRYNSIYSSMNQLNLKNSSWLDMFNPPKQP